MLLYIHECNTTQYPGAYFLSNSYVKHDVENADPLSTSLTRRPSTVVTAQVIPDPNAGDGSEGTPAMRQSLSDSQFTSLLAAI